MPLVVPRFVWVFVGMNAAAALSAFSRRNTPALVAFVVAVGLGSYVARRLRPALEVVS